LQLHEGEREAEGLMMKAKSSGSIPLDPAGHALGGEWRGRAFRESFLKRRISKLSSPDRVKITLPFWLL
jgi:hypothetical protein